MKRTVLYNFIFSILIFSLISCANRKTTKDTDLSVLIDSLIEPKSIRPFNGIVLISKDGKIEKLKEYGFSDINFEIPIKRTQQFVIGSLSKQITAVLILQEFEKNNIELNQCIKKYLPDLQKEWADSVTIHQLLNHTHGINDLNKPLKFKQGTNFSYSNLGYELLGRILETITQKSYAKLSSDLFKKCGMLNSIDPRISDKRNLIPAISRDENSNFVNEQETFSSSYVPAGLVLSTIEDLYLWNESLHNGKLLNKENYNLMISPSAKQNHSLFGEVGYGYALRICENDGILEIGHTGYVSGYLSMNFYYPKTKTSVITLENLDWKDDSIKNTFYFELAIRDLVRDNELNNNR